MKEIITEIGTEMDKYRVEKKGPGVAGLESFGFLREIVLSDEAIEEQTRRVQERIEEAEEEMEVYPSIKDIKFLDVADEAYDNYNDYLIGVSSILSTKKLLTEVGVYVSPSEQDFRSIAFLNRDVQSLLPKCIKNIFSNLAKGIKESTLNDAYELLFYTLKEDLQKLSVYSFESLSELYPSREEYDDFIEERTEDILDRMFKSRFTMGILMYHNGVDEAKAELKEVFHKFGVEELDHIIDKVTPEQLISEPSQFQTILTYAINGSNELRGKLYEHQEELIGSITKIVQELGTKNALGKFNQAGNNMIGNVYPTINIAELLALCLVNCSYAIRKAEKLEDLEAYQTLIGALDSEAYEVVANKNGMEYNDKVPYLILSVPSLYVSDIVASTLSLRSLDGSFQALCSSIMNLIVPEINDLVKELEEGIKKEVEEETPAIEEAVIVDNENEEMNA